MGHFHGTYADRSGQPRNCQLTIYNNRIITNPYGLCLPDNHASCQRYDDRLATHAISMNLPCDAGWEDFLIGAHQHNIASSI